MEILRTVVAEFDSVLEEMVEELPVVALGLEGNIQPVHELLEDCGGDLIHEGAFEEGRVVGLEAPGWEIGIRRLDEVLNPFTSYESPEHRNLVFHVSWSVLRTNEVEVGGDRLVKGNPDRLGYGVRCLLSHRRDDGGYGWCDRSLNRN